MTQQLINDTIELVERVGLNVHSMPNAIGMWPNEQECLAWLADNAEEGNYLEIGSFCGGSAIIMANIIKDKYVFCVDNDFNTMFDINVKRAKLVNKCIKINDYSQNLDKYYTQVNNISLAFIDGYHSYSQIIIDFNILKPIFTQTAIVAFHDTSPYLDDDKYRNNLINEIKDKNIVSTNEDFLVDEAICKILSENPDFYYLNIPVKKDILHDKETGLKSWVRGTTSPNNSLVAIKGKI